MNVYSLLWIAAKTAEKLPENLKEQSAVFSESFFKTIIEGLKTDGVVQINNFGVFTLKDNNISFMPDASFADAVNLPFAYFEPIAIDDDEIVNSLQNFDNLNASETIEPETRLEPETTESEKVENKIEESSEATIKEPETTIEEKPEEIKDSAEEPKDTEEETYVNYSEPNRGYSNFWTIFALIFGAALGYIVGSNYPYYERWTPGQDSEEEIVAEQQVIAEEAEVISLTDSIARNDSVSEPEAAVATVETPVKAEKIVYDTVSSRRYLTTMSRRHYGAPDFWPYIYLENSEKLGHPDRIQPSTVVVIPPAEKYGIDPNNPESIAAAKREGAKIYSHYRK